MSVILGGALAVVSAVMLDGSSQAEWAAGFYRTAGFVVLFMALLAAVPGIWLLVRGRSV